MQCIYIYIDLFKRREPMLPIDWDTLKASSTCAEETAGHSSLNDPGAGSIFLMGRS